MKYMDQIQIQIQKQAFCKNQIQIQKIQIQVRKYKYVFDPIPGTGLAVQGLRFQRQYIIIRQI